MSEGTEAKLVKLIVPAPKTERGHGQHLSTTSKDGDKLIYGSGWSVFWRSLDNPSEGDSFTGHRAEVRCATFAPSGIFVGSGDAHGQLKTWEWKNKRVKFDGQVLNKCNDLAWSMDSKRVVVGGHGAPDFGKAVTYDSGNSVGAITNHSKEILSIASTPGRPMRVVTASEDLTLNFYQAFPAKFDKGHKGKFDRYPNCVRFSPDGKHFVAVGSDSKIVLGDAKEGGLLKDIGTKKTGHKGSAIYNFSWSPDSTQILTVSSDKRALIWDVESGEVKTEFNFLSKSKDWQDQLVSSFWHKGKDKDFIGVLSLRGEIILLDPSAPDAPASRLQTQTSVPTVVKVDRAAGKFYVAGSGGDITEFDSKTHDSRWVSGTGHNGKNIVGLAFTEAEVVSAGFDNKVFFSDKKTLEYGTSVALPSQPSGIVAGNKTGDLILVTLRKGAILVIRNKTIVKTLEVSYEPEGLCINCDDSEVTVSSKQKTIYTYSFDAAANTLTETSKNEGDSPKTSTLCAAHPSEPKTVTVCNNDKQLLIFKEGKLQNRTGWPFHTGAIRGLAWSPDGKRLATAGMDESVFLWTDFETFKATRTQIGGIFQGATSVDWIDDKHIVVSAYDMSVQIYEV